MGGKVKLRFTLLDGIIIVFVGLAAAAVVWYLSRGGITGSPAQVHYTVEFQGVSENFQGRPQIGDLVFDSVRGYDIGVVTDVTYENPTTYTWDEDAGVWNKIESPNKLLNCFLTISSSGTDSDSAVTVGSENMEIRVGKEMFVKGKGYASIGYVTWMDVVEGGGNL